MSELRDPALSVVVVTWNNRDHIAACLASVRSSAGSLEHEVVVVDNYSADGTADLVASSSRGVQLVRNAENRGFPRAANQGLRLARGRYCLLLNPDTIVLGEALRAMVAFMDAHPAVGVSGCRVENPDGTLQRGCRRLLPTPRRMLFRLVGLGALFPRSRLFSEYTMTFRREDECHRVEAVSGSFLLVRREAMDQVGLLDESFFMYGEDLDWCARIGESGWGVFYYPGARVLHYLGQSSRQARERTIRELHRAGAIYYRKHLAAQSPVVLNAIILGGLRLRCTALLGAWRLAGMVGRLLRPVRGGSRAGVPQVGLGGEN